MGRVALEWPGTRRQKDKAQKSSHASGCPEASVLRQNVQQNRDLLPQAREVAVCRVPHFVEVDAEVAVHQDIPHSGGLGPWQEGSEFSNGGRNVGQGLAKDLEMVDDPGLNQLVALKSCPPPTDVLLNAVDRLDRVLQPFSLSPQSGLASRSSRSRTLGLRPREDTTSTETPSRAFNSSTS
jgi:hypothetical protein